MDIHQGIEMADLEDLRDHRLQIGDEYAPLGGFHPARGDDEAAQSRARHVLDAGKVEDERGLVVQGGFDVGHEICPEPLASVLVQATGDPQDHRIRVAPGDDVHRSSYGGGRAIVGKVASGGNLSDRAGCAEMTRSTIAALPAGRRWWSASSRRSRRGRPARAGPRPTRAPPGSPSRSRARAARVSARRAAPKANRASSP